MIRSKNDGRIVHLPSENGCGRRDFLRVGAGAVAAGVTALWLPGGEQAHGAQKAAAPMAGQVFKVVSKPALAAIEALAAQDVQNGGAAPAPIPWLDKNGSFNQAPGPGQEPSNIFHFKGSVARANGFTGMGTDNRGRRIPFGTNTTDYSFMQGVYWAGRAERQGAFTHT
jgi:hypothetical protein